MLEFCGQGATGCGTSLSVQNHAVLRVNASLFQHNYNHLQILNHPIIRSGRRQRGGGIRRRKGKRKEERGEEEEDEKEVAAAAGGRRMRWRREERRRIGFQARTCCGVSVSDSRLETLC